MLIAFGLLFAEAEFPPPIPGWRELTVQESTDRQQIANPQASVPKEAPDNVYDSLGEAYADHGDRELAIKSYEKAVQLNPNNQGAKEALDGLRAH
jgi:cytochrome c-type biogenesis protein CcmH/NrfG